MSATVVDTGGTVASPLRLDALRGRLVGSLWFWPAVAIVVAVVGGVLLSQLDPGRGVDGVTRFGGTPEGARAILSTMAGSIITVAGVVFSLTVVALQVAASQYTPRLLSTFLSDRGTQAVLSVFLGTFTYALVVQRAVRSPDADGKGGFVPDVAVGVALLLALASVAMLVYFLHHLTQQLRLETVLAELRQETLAAVQRTGGSEDDGPIAELPDVPDDHLVLRARRSGNLQATRIEELRRAAERHGVGIRLLPGIGVHVTEGTTLAWAWAVDEEVRLADVDRDRLERDVHEAIHLGRDRSLERDAAFGVRQLVDIAARALSTGVNDPTSAVSAIDAMAEILVAALQTPPSSPIRVDDRGRVRAVTTPITFPELLALACDQPRRYGSQEPAVLVALLRLLTDVGDAGLADEHRDVVRRQVDTTVEVAADAPLSATERARVDRAAQQARVACDRGRRAPHLELEDDHDDEPAT